MAILDLSKVSANTFLPEGESVCTVRASKEVASKEKGTPMIEVEVSDRLGRSDRINFVLSEKALFRIKGFALACGFKEDGMQRFDTTKLVGKKVLVIKTQKGTRMFDGREVKDYEHNFGPVEGATAAAAPGAAPANEGGFTEDEIPF